MRFIASSESTKSARMLIVKRNVRIAVTAFLVVWIFIFPEIARADDHLRSNPFTIPSMIDIAYEPPKSAELQHVYQAMQKRLVLEQAQRFLSPLVLKQRLMIKAAECGGLSYLPYKFGGPVTLCYEFVNQVLNSTPADGSFGLVGTLRVSEEMAIVGPVVQELLHDVALAVFELQEVPVWGNAEFAADNVAAFLMLQFGTDVAMKTILGTAYFLNVREGQTKYSVDYLADVRPTVRQRYYNLLCIAYGSDPVKFSAFTPYNRTNLTTDIPSFRARECSDEFKQVQSAFVTTILPFVNLDRQKEVLATRWLAD